MDRKPVVVGPTANELERDAAREPSIESGPVLPKDALRREPLAMLVRRGFRPCFAKADLPFDPSMPEAQVQRIAEQLEHYGFRLFLRGAILNPNGFAPEEATRFLSATQASDNAEKLLSLDLAVQLPDGRYKMKRPASTFGSTLEWYVARELRTRFGIDAVAGVQLTAKGVGGDLDVLGATEGKLIAMELKSSPPKHLSEEEVSAFFDRLLALKPHLAIFVVDTALRLEDKVIAMLEAELDRRSDSRGTNRARRIERELWALSPSLYAVNAKPSLMANIGRVIAEGLRATAPNPW